MLSLFLILLMYKVIFYLLKMHCYRIAQSRVFLHFQDLYKEVSSCVHLNTNKCILHVIFWKKVL
jgi:hypothetical protein